MSALTMASIVFVTIWLVGAILAALTIVTEGHHSHVRWWKVVLASLAWPWMIWSGRQMGWEDRREGDEP
jgi:hypothetical protein